MTTDVLRQLQEQMSQELLMGHIREFDKWNKHAGTPEELESLKYVEQEMQSYGFETQLILHDAYISLPGAARVEALGSTFECITHSFSRSSEPSGLTAGVVYVGAGRPDDYAGVNAQGKIVLVDGIANPGATVEANRRGAVGQIHVSPHEYVHEMCISPVWGSPGDDQVERLPKSVVVTVPFDAGERLKQAVKQGDDVEATLVAEVDTGWRKTPILVADFVRPGHGGDDPFVFFTGHHDTWYFGVMDNGGANATMMEVARLCALHPDLWQRSLRVVFWSGHSQGRYSSSSWYADTHWEEIEQRAVAHVNVDSTGGLGNTIVADTTASSELRHIAEEALLTESGQVFSGRRMQRAGDQSFWGIGVPSIFGNMSEQPAQPGEANASAAVFGGGNRLGHGTGWWWHTPYDTGDKMDADILVRDTKIYQHAVWRLLTDPVLPLNYVTYVEDLLTTVARLQDQVPDRFDLTPVMDRARQLEASVRQLQDVAETAAGNAALAARTNDCLQQLSRNLVPLDYSYGDRFAHDPALPLTPLPALRDVPKLATLSPDSDEFKFLSSRLVRERNRVCIGLRDAIRVVDEYLQSI